MNTYEGSCVLKNMTKEDIIKICVKMHPEMSREEITEKLNNGEGIEFDIGYAIKKVKEIVSQSSTRN